MCSFVLSMQTAAGCNRTTITIGFLQHHDDVSFPALSQSTNAKICSAFQIFWLGYCLIFYMVKSISCMHQKVKTILNEWNEIHKILFWLKLKKTGNLVQMLTFLIFFCWEKIDKTKENNASKTKNDLNQEYCSWFSFSFLSWLTLFSYLGVNREKKRKTLTENLQKFLSNFQFIV